MCNIFFRLQLELLIIIAVNCVLCSFHHTAGKSVSTVIVLGPLLILLVTLAAMIAVLVKGKCKHFMSPKCQVPGNG